MIQKNKSNVNSSSSTALKDNEHDVSNYNNNKVNNYKEKVRPISK